MKASPLQIPGKGIRPPDPSSNPRCPHCHKSFIQAKLVIDPYTKKVIRVCPHCEKPI